MSRFRHAVALVQSFLIEGRRSKEALFWNLAFPLLVLVVLVLVLGGGSAAGARQVLPGAMTINLLAASFFGISLQMVRLREAGLYRRLRVTPVSALSVVLAHAVTALLLAGVSMGLQLTTAVVAFGVDVAGSAGDVALALLLSAFAFIPLGLLVGSVARDMKAAPALGNLLSFPMIFLSGAALPLFLMPEWLQQTARLLPATYVVEALRRALVDGDFAIFSLPAAVLAGTGLLALSWNAALFRWESREPIRRRGLALVVAGLAVIYVSLFAAGVRLNATERPAAPAAEKSEAP